jgi:ribosomal peptide maturation radical SAM protein 1
MYNIVLLNLPFTETQYPSIALTQLKYVLDERFGKRVSTEICYINHDFVRYLGSGLHRAILGGYEHFQSGLAEWFFRQTAFPAWADNTDEYLQHFYAGPQKQANFLYTLLKKRQGLDVFLDEMIAKYHLSQAHLVGLTSMFSQNLACMSMARKLKEQNAELVTVMGGANCETPMGEGIVKNVEALDFVFSGPALVSFPQFIEYRLSGDVEACHRISGVFSKVNCLPEDTGTSIVDTGDHKGASLRTLEHANLPQIGPGTVGQERDINEVVELDYRSFLYSLTSHFPNHEVPPVLFFETSRGCWWGERSHCTFCGLNGLGMNYRAMQPQKAIAYLNSLSAYADECAYFNCVDNILPRNYPKEVLPFINMPPPVTLFYEVKADLSEADIQRLAQARVTFVQPGIEALATATLKLMRKGTTAFQNLRLLKHCVTHEVFPTWNLLVGFPGEKEEVYQKYIQDFPKLAHLPPPTGAISIRFDRYSPYFTRAAEYGLDLAPFAFYELVYPWSKESLQSLAYYFEDQNPQPDYRVLANKWLGKMRAQVEQWKRAWLPRGETQMVWGKWYHPNLPKLLFKQQGDETLIHDSRSGKLVRYQIRETTKQILQYLDQSHKKADLLKQFNHLSPAEIEQEIAFLQDRGLLFEDDERFMSLVLPGQLSTSSPVVHKKSELPIVGTGSAQGTTPTAPVRART